MIRKTEGIVLKTLKFKESSLISTIYTREYGLKSFIVQGYRSTRSRKRHSYFQPMSNIDLVFYDKESRDLQKITESSNQYFFKELQTQPVKIALGVLTIEIFTASVKEQEKNEALFLFLKTTLIRLDSLESKLIHVFLFYLIHLTRHLGFFPRLEVRDTGQPIYFNLAEGLISNRPAPEGANTLMMRLMGSDADSCRNLSFSNKEKRELIELMFRYYQHHVAGFKIPASIEVFEEIFAG